MIGCRLVPLLAGKVGPERLAVVLAFAAELDAQHEAQRRVDLEREADAFARRILARSVLGGEHRAAPPRRSVPRRLELLVSVAASSAAHRGQPLTDEACDTLELVAQLVAEACRPKLSAREAGTARRGGPWSGGAAWQAEHGVAWQDEAREATATWFNDVPVNAHVSIDDARYLLETGMAPRDVEQVRPRKPARRPSQRPTQRPSQRPSQLRDVRRGPVSPREPRPVRDRQHHQAGDAVARLPLGAQPASPAASFLVLVAAFADGPSTARSPGFAGAPGRPAPSIDSGRRPALSRSGVPLGGLRGPRHVRAWPGSVIDNRARGPPE